MWDNVLGAAWNGAIYAVGIVTIVFAILDHEKLRITVLDNWNPANLPEPQAGRPIPRSETVIGLVFALTFLVWWIDLVRVPAIAFYDGDPVRFMPATDLGAAVLPDSRVARRERRHLPDRSGAAVAHAGGVGRRHHPRPGQRGDRGDDPQERTTYVDVFADPQYRGARGASRQVGRTCRSPGSSWPSAW